MVGAVGKFILLLLLSSFVGREVLRRVVVGASVVLVVAPGGVGPGGLKTAGESVFGRLGCGIFGPGADGRVGALFGR